MYNLHVWAHIQAAFWHVDLRKHNCFQACVQSFFLLRSARPLLTVIPLWYPFQPAQDLQLLSLPPEQPAWYKAPWAFREAQTKGPGLNISCRLLGGAWRKQMAMHASTGAINPRWTGLATWNDTLLPKLAIYLLRFTHSSCHWHS